MLLSLAFSICCPIPSPPHRGLVGFSESGLLFFESEIASVEVLICFPAAAMSSLAVFLAALAPLTDFKALLAAARVSFNVLLYLSRSWGLASKCARRLGLCDGLKSFSNLSRLSLFSLSPSDSNGKTLPLSAFRTPKAFSIIFSIFID